MRKPNNSNRLFWESAADNNASYIQYYNRLVELAVSMFEWKNLPDTVDERFMELALFNDGKALFFKDEDLGFLCLRCSANGLWDVYNVPRKRRAYASNAYHKDLDQSNSVIIWNNYLRTSSKLDVEIFSKRLYNLDRAIDVNANAQKTPILLQCTEPQRLTLLNLYKKYQGNEPFIFADKNLDLNSIKVIKTDAPYVAQELYELKTKIYNEALTYLGISNLNLQKKERLVSDEVMRSMGGTIASRHSRLEMRRKACDEINKMFGLNIAVDFREDYREIDDEIVLTGDTEDGKLATAFTDLRTNFSGGKTNE